MGLLYLYLLMECRNDKNNLGILAGDGDICFLKTPKMAHGHTQPHPTPINEYRDLFLPEVKRSERAADHYS